MTRTFWRRQGERASSVRKSRQGTGASRHPRFRRTTAAIVVLLVFGFTLTACTKTATHEPGAYTYDALEQSGEGTYTFSQGAVPAYTGSWVAKAHLGSQPSAGSHGRGVFDTAPSTGSAGMYGAAFYFPAGTFSGPDPKQQGTLDVLGWDVGGGAEYGGIRIDPDHSARLVRSRAGQTDTIGSPFSLQEGCWNWLVVRQLSLSDSPPGAYTQASSEVFLNGEKIVDSHAPNNFGRSYGGGHLAERVRIGIVAADTQAQHSDLDFYVDDSYVSTALTKSPSSRACDPHGDPEPPAIDPTAPTPLSEQTKFLYSGEFPIQHGVAPGTIEPKRAAVVRGRVLSRGGDPLPDVRVIAPDHPELGFTTTRPDGNFYLAANGGGEVRLRFEKDGYLPVERRIDVPWQDYAFTDDDVVLTPLDSAATDIDLDNPPAPIQVARGSAVTDPDGTRRATLLFPAGTQATMTLPDNSTQPVTDLRVRATEYTVGSSGPEAMPAELPATSAYTYAVDYTVDQAQAADAKRVSFSQPVLSYTDNFVGIPVGEPVPTGYYDQDKGAWVAIDSGRVVKVLSESGGMAVLDVDGSGNAATPTQLQNLGITDAERTELSVLYDTGNELWRVPLEHFSPRDMNTRLLVPPGATGPLESLRPGEVTSSCPESGSIIECENQALGQELDVTGTPFALHYQSDRQPGATSPDRLEVPVSGSSVPAPLVRIEAEAEVAGRHFSQSFPPQPNQDFTFTWDGKDAFGRTLYGSQPVKIRVAYIYHPLMAGASRFGLSDGDPYPVDTRSEYPIFQEYRQTIGHWDASKQGLGGWSLDPHHVYDPASQTLYLGDGTKLRAESVNRVIERVAGNGSGYGGDGGPASQAQLARPQGIAVAPDGSVYIADAQNQRVRKIAPDGTITTVAGTGQAGYNGDGIPATQAMLQFPWDVELGPDGSLYIADKLNYRIRKVDPQGTITTVAGTGVRGISDDGTLATQAKVEDVTAIARAPDGSLYFTHSDSHSMVRRIMPDGRVVRVAGLGFGAYGGDGGPARDAFLNAPAGIDVGPDGSVYVADSANNAVRRIAPDGIITTVAGNGSRGYSGDGGPATQAQIRGPTDVAVGADGVLYVAEDTRHVRQVTPAGVITTVAGDETTVVPGDQGPARRAWIDSPLAVAVAPDTSLYLGEFATAKVHRVRPPLPGFSADDIAIPSEDGSELYRFDEQGRHLSTADTHTGATLYSFSYDSAGRLTSITDGDGNLTQVQHDSQGRPSAIVAPFGQHTTLGLDANGYLNSVTNPENEQTQLGYSSDGLLETLTDPKGGVKGYDYDSVGRLERADDQGAGFKTLSRTNAADSYETTLTTKLGRASKYKVEQLPSGDMRRTHTDQASLESTLRQGQDGTNTATTVDGTVTTIRRGPDPRFGMNASILADMSVATPGGHDLSLTGSRALSLGDPFDPLSLQSETDTLTVNGRAYTTAFDRSQSRFTATSAESRTTTTDIDDQGRPTREEATGVTPLVSAYKPNGLLETQTQGARGWGYTYETSGVLDTITDPLGRTTSFDYDGAGRVTRQTLPGGREIGYAYDDNGNLASVTPPTRPAHIFTDTPVDLLETYTAPAVSGDPTLPRTTTYSYNDDQQLELITRPGGSQVDLDYGAQTGRLEHLTSPRGVTDLSYDSQTGNLDSITAPGGEQLAMEYDGSLPTQETFAGTVSGSVGRSYDDDLRLDTSSVNGAHTVDYSYDDDSLLTGVGALTLTRDPDNGLLRGSTLGSTTTTLDYNDFAEPDSLTAEFGASTLYGATYTRDDLGRIETKTETNSQGTHTYGYTYDPQTGFLEEVRKDGLLISTYGYDDNGNRTSALTDGTAKTGTYDDQDRLASYGPNAYTYTAAGELRTKTTAGQTTTYGYDALGSLENVELADGTLIDYITDGRGRRIAKKRDGQLEQGFLYGAEALGPVAELDSAGDLESRFIYATRSNVPDYMTKGGNTYRIFTDHLGSPRVIVDASSGTVAQELDYDEVGNVLRDTNPGFQPFGFAGGMYDRDTQLVGFSHRDYDPEVGRWTTKDPIFFMADDSNVYGYVINDPVNLADPPGLFWQKVADFTAAFGDTVTSPLGWVGGATTYDVREWMGTNDVVNFCSGFYQAGGIAGQFELTALAGSATTVGLGKLGETVATRTQLGNRLFGREIPIRHGGGGTGPPGSPQINGAWNNGDLRIGMGWREKDQRQIFRIGIGAKHFDFLR